MRLKAQSDNTFFHPYEVTFSGFSNSGKTTLLRSLTNRLSQQYDIGYFKHDSHNFSMDKEGKDTWHLKNAGAKQIFINDQNHNATLNYLEFDQVNIRDYFIDSDFLFVEGHKHSQLPKVLVISDKTLKDTLEEINKGTINNIIAVVTESQSDPLSGKHPHFQRDDIGGISEFIIEYLKNKISHKINGLILTGGQSKRMATDKGGLIYHSNDQIQRNIDLLAPYCDNIFVSCKDQQSELSFIKNHTILPDAFPGSGPIIGVLSAFNKSSNPWIVLGCDLPYLEHQTIKKLIEKRNPFKNATCFENPEKKWPEPLCTIYEPKSFLKLMKYYANNKPCPRKVLFNSNIELLQLDHVMALENVNTPEQREQAMNYILKNENLYAN